MADEKITISELKNYMRRFVDRRNWQQFHSPKNLAMGLAIETGELLEHFQWISEQQSREVVRNEKEMALVKEEVADVFSYLLALTETMGIDLSEAFYDKMKRNDAKYPAEKYYGRYKI